MCFRSFFGRVDPSSHKTKSSAPSSKSKQSKSEEVRGEEGRSEPEGEKEGPTSCSGADSPVFKKRNRSRKRVIVDSDEEEEEEEEDGGGQGVSGGVDEENGTKEKLVSDGEKEDAMDDGNKEVHSGKEDTPVGNGGYKASTDDGKPLTFGRIIACDFSCAFNLSLLCRKCSAL